ncbi:hypothetical protein RJZ56_005983 [Blastomyces dermatitidis]
MSIATNKRSRDYEDDEESNTSFGSQCSGSCSDSDSVVLEINSTKDMPGLDYKIGDVVFKPRVPSAGDSKDTSIAIDHGVQDPSDDDRIPISITAPNMCSWEPSVGSDDESDSEGQTPPPPVLIEDGGVTTEEWLVDEILESKLENDDQKMRWYLVKWRGYDPSWQPEDDLIPGCEELVHEFHAKAGRVESHRSLKRRGRPPLKSRSKKARFTSQVLPNISDLQNAEEQGQIISASDASLPRWQMGHGKGAFAAEYSCVRVPSATCFVEASLLNFVRQARKKDYGSALDMHYLGCATYMIEYAYPGGYLDLDSLQPVFRTFLVDGFLNHNSSALFAAARGRLMASEIK